MNRKYYKILDFLGNLRNIYLIGAVIAVIYFWFIPIPKYEKDFINDEYYYKIVKQPGFYLVEGQELEHIVLERSIKRRKHYLRCKDIYYGVEVHSWSKEIERPVPISDDDLFYVSDELIDNNRDSIIEVRGQKIVEIKPNHKGIETSLIINDMDSGKPTYYYDTRIWAYGNMYVVHLNACIETTNTKEHRAEKDKDYSQTYKEIIESFQIDKKIVNPQSL